MTDTSPQSEEPHEASIASRKGEELLSAPEAVSRRRKRDRVVALLKHVGYRIFRLSGEFTAIILGIAFFWIAALNIVLAKGSVDITFLQKNAELWFSEAFNGSDADIGLMTLDWHPASNAVVFTARQVSITDDQSREIQYIESLKSEIGIARVLSGQLDPRRLHIKGGAVTWKRFEDGSVVAGLGTPETVGKLGPVWTGRAAKPRERGVFSLGGLETVTVNNAVAYLDNARDGLQLQLSDTFIDLNNIGQTFELKAKTNVIIGDTGAPLTADLVLSPDFKDFDLLLEGKNLNPKALAPDRGTASIMQRLDAPLDVNVRVTATRETGLNRVDVDMTAQGGRLTSGSLDQTFDKADLKARYDPANQALRFTDINLKSNTLDLRGIASLYGIGSPADGFFKDQSNFSLDLSELKLGASQRFQHPFDMEHVRIAGKYDRPSRQTEFSEFDLDFGSFETDFTGKVKRDNDGNFQRLALEGAVTGTLSPEDLLSLWPKDFALGAREWISRCMLKAELKNLKLDLDIPFDQLENRRLKVEHLNLTFDVTNADVQYISTMTPLTNASGRGHLTGNSFEIFSDSGQVGALKVNRGEVKIPRLSPKGGDLIIDIDGEGQVADFLALIDQKPFQFASRHNVKPEEFAGQGQINLKVTRPLLVNFDPSRIQYSASGNLTGITAPFSVGPHKLQNGAVTLHTDRKGLTVTGPVQIGPWVTDLEWKEVFDNGATPSMFRVSGPLSRDDLDGFGIGFREYISGDIDLTVEATGNGVVVTGATIAADLTRANMHAGHFWSKAVGLPGTLNGRLDRGTDGRMIFKDVSIQAPGMNVQGDISLAENLRLINLDLSTAKIDNFVDSRIQVIPDEQHARFDIAMSGNYLDVSPLIANSMTSQSSEMDFPLRLSASLDTFKLKPDYVIRNAGIVYAHDGIGVSEAQITGGVEGLPFALGMTTNDAARLREVEISIPDASHAAKAFFGMDNIEGGTLTIEAGLPMTGDTGPLQGVAEIDKFTLVRAPALAQMLSMASLQGLGDTLGGGGIGFDRFEVPFSVNNGQLSIRKARVSGPAMGLTGDGDFNLKSKELDFDGVLVPAYSANSLLGGIPVLGDILVGKKGEGIFALSYTVKGSLDQTTVAVNPLSALTPGFLRGIFKPSRKSMEDIEMTEEIDAVKPKTDKN